MLSRALLLLGLVLLIGCQDDQVILNKAPFQNLACGQPTDDSFADIQRRSATFAYANNLHFRPADYSVLLANEHLNLILVKHPARPEIFATAISRSEPTEQDAVTFRRLISDLNLRCLPAAN
jgi:hypothetical protein